MKKLYKYIPIDEPLELDYIDYIAIGLFVAFVLSVAGFFVLKMAGVFLL